MIQGAKEAGGHLTRAAALGCALRSEYIREAGFRVRYLKTNTGIGSGFDQMLCVVKLLS